jgi:mutual gliding-motility protein MglA
MYLDSASGQLHLRVVYAGAPLSGKTETLRALLPSLHGRPASEVLFSPSEARGRTLYFDWAQWRGGLFRAGQLNCQITAVPGQESLLVRRRTLVEDADAVVFVVDSQKEQMAANRRSLDELRPWLEREGLPAVPVIYQCNKRDLPDPAALDDIRAALGLDRSIELYECSATQGEGIRICFVACIGACVRRAETLLGLKKMPDGMPAVQSADDLLAHLREAEKGAGVEELVIAPLPETEAAPAKAAAAPAPVATPAPVVRARPPVMPMADWLAGQEREAAAAAAAAAALPPSASVAAPAVPVAAPAPSRARPAVMPMADWLASTAAAAVAAPVPAEKVAVRSAPGSAAVAAAAAPAPRPVVMPMADVLPVPWIRGREATLLEAWPAGAWRDTFSSADPAAPAPALNGHVLQGALGAGRLARASRLHGRPDEARAEYRRLMQWLTLLDGAASSPRCLVLSGTDAGGWCAWQLMQRFPTLDLLVVRAFDKGLTSKDAAQYLAYAANSYVVAWGEFARREPRLPVALRTLARQERRTVYADFLPHPAPKPPDEPVLARLETELRVLVTPERIGSVNVPEVLRELESLAANRPHVAEIVELLQSLLIGE